MTQVSIPVLHPPNELTHETIPDLDKRLAPHLEAEAQGLVIDLSKVSMITSAGLGRLVHIGQTFGERGSPVYLAGGRRAIVKLIRTVGLHEVMPHFPEVEAAVAWFSKSAQK